MEGGSVWISPPFLLATVSACAGATLVSIIRGMRPRGWAKPAPLGAVALALILVFGEMVAFPVVFHSFPPSCLGEEREGEQ